MPYSVVTADQGRRTEKVNVIPVVDGSLVVSTPVDVIFLILPYLQKAQEKVGGLDLMT